MSVSDEEVWEAVEVIERAPYLPHEDEPGYDGFVETLIYRAAQALLSHMVLHGVSREHLLGNLGMDIQFG